MNLNLVLRYRGMGWQYFFNYMLNLKYKLQMQKSIQYNMLYILL